MLATAPVVLGSDPGPQRVAVRHPPVEALATEDAQLVLGDVHPTAVLGGVVDLPLVGQPFQPGGKVSSSEAGVEV
jgi:hypothetical protein